MTYHQQEMSERWHLRTFLEVSICLFSPILTLYNRPPEQLICPGPNFLAPERSTHMSQSSIKRFWKSELCHLRTGPFLVRCCVKYYQNGMYSINKYVVPCYLQMNIFKGIINSVSRLSFNETDYYE